MSTIEEYSNAIEKTKAAIEQAKLTQTELNNLIALSSNPWPQTQLNPEYSPTTGFLPPVLIQPTIDMVGSSPIPGVLGEYKFKDWRGQKLSKLANKTTPIKKFEKSINIPKSDIKNNPYSMRDVALIFGDTRYDYFKHGLQFVDGMGIVEDGSNPNSTLRLDRFAETPWELNDPVFFGFDIVFDAGSSPLLNGSIIDFLNQYTNVNELQSKLAVYEEFKNQFVKLFRTDINVKVDYNQVAFTRTKTNVANLDGNSSIFEPGKKAYLGYYLKKISGLDALSENNKGDTLKYITDWKKDFIQLDFYEDVSLTLGALSHLYKLLYWSKPNGKMLIPENLLRFNCQIIISECRNFNRVKKSLATGNLEVIKDNLSRYVYSLRECQFYFDKMPHGNDSDVGTQGPQIYDNHSAFFDFKYSSLKMERFVPANDWGTYVGFDNGAIWKIGNPGARDARTSGASRDTSNPTFFTVGQNSLNNNGVQKPFIMDIYGVNPSTNVATTGTSETINPSNVNSDSGSSYSSNTTDVSSLQKSSQINSDSISQQNIDLVDQKTSGFYQKSSTKNISDTLSKASFDKVKIPASKNIKDVLSVSSSFNKETNLEPKKLNGFFDIRQTLKDNLPKVENTSTTIDKFKSIDITNSLNSLTNTDTSNLGSKALDASKAMFNSEIEKAKSTYGNGLNLSDIKNQFSNIPDQATNQFFDLKGTLKSNFELSKQQFSDGKNSLKEAIGDNGLGKIDMSNLGSKALDASKAMFNSEIEKAKSTFGSGLDLDSINQNYSKAVNLSSTDFFDVRSQIKNISGTDTSSQNLRKNLLNKAIDKVYNTPIGSVSNLTSNPPTSTTFFDKKNELKNEVKKFGGGLFGDNLFG
jgi:hypothetical protein